MMPADYEKAIKEAISDPETITVESFEKMRKNAEKKYSDHFGGRPTEMMWVFGEAVYNRLKELGCLPKGSVKQETLKEKNEKRT